MSLNTLIPTVQLTRSETQYLIDTINSVMEEEFIDEGVVMELRDAKKLLVANLAYANQVAKQVAQGTTDA